MSTVHTRSRIRPFMPPRTCQAFSFLWQLFYTPSLTLCSPQIPQNYFALISSSGRRQVWQKWRHPEHFVVKGCLQITSVQIKVYLAWSN